MIWDTITTIMMSLLWKIQSNKIYANAYSKMSKMVSYVSTSQKITMAFYPNPGGFGMLVASVAAP